MSKARSPRDVCSTTIGPRGLIGRRVYRSRITVLGGCAGNPASCQPALLQIALVVVLGGPERTGGDDLGGDWAAVLGLDPFFDRDRLALLFGGVEEDRGAVLVADVGTLA